MKKLLLVSSVCLFLTGGGLKPIPAVVKAETPLSVAQLNNSSQTPPAMQTQVELLDAGIEPRQELRFTPVANSKQTATMRTSMDVTSTISGQPMPQIKVPSSDMTMEVTITQVDANGDIHSEFAFTQANVLAEPDVPPEVLNAMRSALKQVVGLRGSSIMDNRGQIKSGNLVLPQGLDPVTKQLFEQVSNSLTQLSFPLPVEAVGKGAKWRVSSAFNMGGINLSQSAIYELVDRQDNVITLNVNVEQQADSQELTPPGAPTEISITLKSLSSQGQGRMTMRLDTAMPIRSTMSLSSKNEMNIKQSTSGEEMAVETNLSMQTNLESQGQN
ncbi:MAG: hypothetical protein LDL41_04370 [Coleofasciculus sp. S288]|nr:hypothetical protein [Coleofasciculus sp. S288]